MTAWIGIDPGASGAIAAIRENYEILTRPLPVGIAEDGATVVDVEGLELDLRVLIGGVCDAVVGVEEPLKHAASSAQTLASCWRNFGRITAVLDMMHLTYTVIPPRTWQARRLGKCARGTSKEVSIEIARAEFPHVSLKRTARSKKDDDGVADALNLAAYLRACNPPKPKPSPLEF